MAKRVGICGGRVKRDGAGRVGCCALDPVLAACCEAFPNSHWTVADTTGLDPASLPEITGTFDGRGTILVSATDPLVVPSDLDMDESAALRYSIAGRACLARFGPGAALRRDRDQFASADGGMSQGTESRSRIFAAVSDIHVLVGSAGTDPPPSGSPCLAIMPSGQYLAVSLSIAFDATVVQRPRADAGAAFSAVAIGSASFVWVLDAQGRPVFARAAFGGARSCPLETGSIGRLTVEAPVGGISGGTISNQPFPFALDAAVDAAAEGLRMSAQSLSGEPDASQGNGTFDQQASATCDFSIDASGDAGGGTGIRLEAAAGIASAFRTADSAFGGRIANGVLNVSGSLALTLPAALFQRCAGVVVTDPADGNGGGGGSGGINTGGGGDNGSPIDGDGDGGGGDGGGRPDGGGGGGGSDFGDDDENDGGPIDPSIGGPGIPAPDCATATCDQIRAFAQQVYGNAAFAFLVCPNRTDCFGSGGELEQPEIDEATGGTSGGASGGSAGRGLNPDAGPPAGDPSGRGVRNQGGVPESAVIENHFGGGCCG